MRSSVAVTLTAILAALAIVITISRLEVVYPVLPYLKFDFAEIPSVIAFFLVNPFSGFTTAVIHWLFLIYRAGDVLGPTMKFAAVASMLAGFWVASSVGRRIAKNPNFRAYVIACCLAGGVLRVVVMSIFNIVVLLLIAPAYLDYATYLLQQFFGHPLDSGQTLTWTLIFTGIYNSIHVILTIVPGILIYNVVKRRFPGIESFK
ncbi:MAG: ECF transporter S component [archaeon GB-1867-005]|nr:ECF transporter S component [Candidatus Culexmicrobium cathedralense]